MGNSLIVRYCRNSSRARKGDLRGSEGRSSCEGKFQHRRCLDVPTLDVLVQFLFFGVQFFYLPGLKIP